MAAAFRNRHAPTADPGAVCLAIRRSRDIPYPKIQIRRVLLNFLDAGNVQARHRDLPNVERVLLGRAKPRREALDFVYIILPRILTHPLKGFDDLRVVGGDLVRPVVVEGAAERPSPCERGVRRPVLRPRDDPNARQLPTGPRLPPPVKLPDVPIQFFDALRRLVRVEAYLPKMALVPYKGEIGVRAIRHRPHTAAILVLQPAGKEIIFLLDPGPRNPSIQRSERPVLRPFRYLRAIHKYDVGRPLCGHGCEKLLVVRQVVRRKERPHGDLRVRRFKCLYHGIEGLGL